MSNGIEKMTVDKVKLLEVVKKNLEKHNELYKIAVDSYWKLAEKKLTKMLDRVKNKRKIDNYISITEPTNHEKDYQLIISMLEFSEDKKILLTPQEFSKYVMNDWSWKQEFKATAFANYTGLVSSSITDHSSSYSGYSGYNGLGLNGESGSSGLSGISGNNDDEPEPLDEELLKKIEDF
jgi:hypothetical protein